MSFSHFLTKFHVPVAFSRFYGLPSFHANQTPRSNLHLIGHTPTHFQQQNSFWTRFSAQEGPQVCHYFSKEVSFVFETLLVECNILYTFKNIDQQISSFVDGFLKMDCKNYAGGQIYLFWIVIDFFLLWQNKIG